jgi:hypothetical protein
LREECSLRVIEKNLLRKILRLKRRRCTEGWGKLRSEEHHNRYSTTCYEVIIL